jgi:hypothetical protein
MRRLADWIAGAVSGVVAYRVWKRRHKPAPTTGPADADADDRAEELRAKLAETRASEGNSAGAGVDPPPPEASGAPESVEDRRRRVHEEGRAAIDQMRDDQMRDN